MNLLKGLPNWKEKKNKNWGSSCCMIRVRLVCENCQKLCCRVTRTWQFQRKGRKTSFPVLRGRKREYWEVDRNPWKEPALHHNPMSVVKSPLQQIVLEFSILCFCCCCLFISVRVSVNQILCQGGKSTVFEKKNWNLTRKLVRVPSGQFRKGQRCLGRLV